MFEMTMNIFKLGGGNEYRRKKLWITVRLALIRHGRRICEYCEGNLILKREKYDMVLMVDIGVRTTNPADPSLYTTSRYLKV